MTAVIFFEGELAHTTNRWPALLRAMDGVKQHPVKNDGRGNAAVLTRVLAEYPDHTHVYVVVDKAAQGAPLLDGYQHPAKAVYVFGPDHGEIVPPEGAERVTIYMAPSRRSLFSDQAGAMVLHHRRMQRGDWT